MQHRLPTPWVAVFALACAVAASPAQGSMVLFDFGTTAFGTASPTNGAYWNDLTNRAAGAVFTGVVAADGTPLSLTVSNESVFLQNGGAAFGGLTNPSPAQLGNLAVDSATVDFWAVESNVTSGLRLYFAGLSPTALYSFRLFGTRATSLTRVTEYTVAGATTQSVLLTTSGTDVGGPGYDGNVSNVAVVASIAPDPGGRISLLLRAQTGDFAYLNCLQMDVQEAVPLETVLVDFGNSTLFRSISVTNPDQNGNHWNSMASVATNLVNTASGATALDIGFTSSFAPDSFNGPAGVTTDPLQPSEIANTAIDAAALGMLGVTNAAIDFFSGIDQTFMLSDLDPTKTYSLTFFGSHKYSTDDSTVYSVYSDAAYTNQIAAVSLQVQAPGSPWLHNSNTVATLANLVPQSGNAIYVKFTGSGAAEGYLNAMKIGVYGGATQPDGDVYLTGLSQSAGTIAVSFVGSNTVSYTLQYTTNLLNAAGWDNVLSGASPVSATGDGVSTLTLSDTNHLDRSRIYRLLHTP